MQIFYDSKIIEEFAARLYIKASQVVRNYTLLGAIAGFILGIVIAISWANNVLVVLSIIGAISIIGGALGRYWSTGRAFQLRLQAQTALCQVQIEKNTRNTVV